MDCDQMLFMCHRAPPYSAEEWDRIAAHVVARLQEFLGTPVIASDVQVDPEGPSPGFHCDIASEHDLGGKLAFSWFGRLGSTALGNGHSVHVAAWVFPRCLAKRTLAQSGSAYIYLEYLPASDGVPAWRLIGWEQDVHHEFEGWE